MQQKKLIDLLVVIAMVAVAIPIIVYFNVKPLISTILFFILPSLYLFIREPRPVKRIFAASLLIGVVFAIPFDFLALSNSAWSEPVSQLIFSYKILGVLAIDHLIWFFFWVFLIVTFYEHFVERDLSDTVSHNYKYGMVPGLLGLAGVLIVHIINPELLRFNYAYLVLGFLTLIPMMILLIQKPVMIFKFLKVSVFFFFLYLSFELTALYLGQWNFPGHYIGGVKIFNLEFPFEEFFFWILLSSTVVLSYHELYVDDEK